MNFFKMLPTVFVVAVTCGSILHAEKAFGQRKGAYVKVIDASASLTPDTNGYQYAYAPTMIFEPAADPGGPGKIHCWVGSNPYPAHPGWDTIAYTYSTNLGATWSAPVTVLWPTDTVNERSTCDPSVVFFNGYYYMFYSGNKSNVQTLQFVARASTPQGPWYKYTNSGTWVQNATNPKIIIMPTQPTPDSAPLYGSGEASVVNLNGVLYMWHYDDTTGSATPGLETPANVLRMSTDAVNWTPLVGTNVRWGDPAHSFRYMSVDVKWNPYSKLFIMYAEKHRHEVTSSSVRFFSRDGINWTGPVNEQDLPDYSNNNGFMGDKYGHLCNNGMTLVAYGSPWDMRTDHGADWGHWDLYSHAWRDPIYAKGDFDGDGKLDPCMVDPGTGKWYIRSSRTGQQGIAYGSQNIPWGWQWGGWNGTRHIIACGKYDSDAMTDLAIIDTQTQGGWRWYIISTQYGLGTPTIPWGWQWAGLGSQHELVLGDFDGDGQTDRTVTDRSVPGGATWYCIASGGGLPIPWGWQWGGLAWWQPLICADYDGDGKTDRATVNPMVVGGTSYYIISSRTGGLGTTEIPWGWQWAGVDDRYTPVIADWDGDGKTDRTVVGPNALGTGNQWYCVNSSGTYPWASGWQWGGMADYNQVVVGDYDGDQKADRAITDPDLGSGAAWYVIGSLGGLPVPWGWQSVISY